MDCVRIQFQDCSVHERRAGQVFTFLYANHEDGPPRVVGLVVKGMAHLCKNLGLGPDAVVQIADFLDQIVKDMTLPPDTFPTVQRLEPALLHDVA